MDQPACGNCRFGPAALYSILPGILVSVILTVAVSLADKEPDKEVLKMFDKAQHEVKSVE